MRAVAGLVLVRDHVIRWRRRARGDGMRAAAGPVLVLVFASLASELRAQAAAELAARCGDASGGAAWCAASAAAYEAVAAGMGLVASGGSEIPGTSSTLGRRRGLGPRLAVSARLNGARIPLPAVDPSSASRLPGLHSLVSSASLEAAVGLIDGMRVAPRYGGILALDAIGSVGVVRLPRADGFRGNALSAGIGARLGILRESFDVPGVSLSATRRFFGEARLGADGAPAALRLEAAATSVRAVIGKDLAEAGVVVGAGWDRYSGDATLEGGATQGDRSGGVALAGPPVDRLLVFGALSRTWQVMQVTGEFGWAAGFDGPPGSGTTPFDPGAGSIFASLGLRITR